MFQLHYIRLVSAIIFSIRTPLCFVNSILIRTSNESLKRFFTFKYLKLLFETKIDVLYSFVFLSFWDNIIFLFQNCVYPSMKDILLSAVFSLRQHCLSFIHFTFLLLLYMSIIHFTTFHSRSRYANYPFYNFPFKNYPFYKFSFMKCL